MKGISRARVFIFMSLLICGSSALFFSLSCAIVGGKYRYEKNKSPADKSRAIIFLHGYYGANLSREKDSSRLWLTLPEALWRKNTVARNDPALAVDAAEPLFEDGMLLKVPVIPGLYSIDAYGGTLDWLATTFPDALIVPFAYDWRQDNRLAVKNISDLVKSLKADGMKSVSLVAHSMGGLIVAYYLRYGEDVSENAPENWQGASEVDRVVLAGVPFGGTMHLMRNIHQGVKLGVNSSLLKPEAVASFPSSYQLLPRERGKVLDGKLNVVPYDPRDPDWWDKDNLGYASLGIGGNEELLARRKAFTRETLVSARAFTDKIHAATALSDHSPERKILTIVGTSRKTIDKAVWLETTKRLLFTDADFKEARLPYGLKDLEADGDESITRESARLPLPYQKRFEAREVLTEAPHGDLYKDEKVRGELVKFLGEI